MSALLINNYSTRNIFIGGNRFNTTTDVYTNGSGGTVNLLKGMVVGRIAATGKIAIQVSTAVDGSQEPLGILEEDYTVLNTASTNVKFCIAGDVDANAVIYGGSDTAATVISRTDSGADTVKIGTIGDILNRAGIRLIVTTEMTSQDNP